MRPRYTSNATAWTKTYLTPIMLLAAVGLLGCFGAQAMHYDIQEYNKQVVSSEQEMLLYNIGRLHYNLPPHFMMLASIAQTRQFSTSAGFQWSQVFTAITPTSIIAHTTGNSTSPTSQTSTGSSTTLDQGGNWQAGPFSAGAAENPTIQFVPIQGQEFAQRFESSLTDKITLLLEDERGLLTRKETHNAQSNLLLLTIANLYLLHGNSACPASLNPLRTYNLGDWQFSACIEEIINSRKTYETVDAGHSDSDTGSRRSKSIRLSHGPHWWLRVGESWQQLPIDISYENPRLVRLRSDLHVSPRARAFLHAYFLGRKASALAVHAI